MVPVAEFASVQPEPKVTVTTWPVTVSAVVPPQLEKDPPSTTPVPLVAGRVKPAGKVKVTTSPAASLPVELTLTCTVQVVAAVFATTLEPVKLTAVRPEPAAVIAVVVVVEAVSSEVKAE
jgi:hypothetical protein